MICFVVQARPAFHFLLIHRYSADRRVTNKLASLAQISHSRHSQFWGDIGKEIITTCWWDHRHKVPGSLPFASDYKRFCLSILGCRKFKNISLFLPMFRDVNFWDSRKKWQWCISWSSANGANQGGLILLRCGARYRLDDRTVAREDMGQAVNQWKPILQL